jgi:hypothetical protein
MVLYLLLIISVLFRVLLYGVVFIHYIFSSQVGLGYNTLLMSSRLTTFYKQVDICIKNNLCMNLLHVNLCFKRLGDKYVLDANTL